MLKALNVSKKIVSAKNAVKGEVFYCPLCEQEVRLKAKYSNIVMPHFAHKVLSDCPDDFANEMSEWHTGWQNLFPEENREVVVEDKNGNRRRADILVGNTVIEFQHSPITAEEINKRNYFYLVNGYRVFWVFDADNKIKNNYGKETIDPIFCDRHELCWKREQKQFLGVIQYENVFYFLNYKITLEKAKSNSKECNLLILINGIIETKYLDFCKTYERIISLSLLKEVGINTIIDWPSISDIIRKTQELNKAKQTKNTIPVTRVYRRYSRKPYRNNRRWL